LVTFLFPIQRILKGFSPAALRMSEYDNPWQTVTHKQVYDNPWIRVHEDDVINPSGGEGIYGVVHFKNLAIGIVPVDDQHNTWLVGQYRYALNEYSWEIPMGGSPLEDDPMQGAIRELREETGITANTWQTIMKVHTSNSVTDETGYIYLATDLEIGDTEHEDTEQLIIKRLPLTEVFEMVRKNEITDCMSAAALLRLQSGLHTGEYRL
jgi:8-oxo-dGTP pyrophosphatase MutT (NUDIX family)